MTHTTRPRAPRGEAQGEGPSTQSSQLTGTVVSLIAWAVVALPLILLAVLIFAEVMQPDRGLADPRNLALMFGGAVLLLCMLATPHLMGQAARFQERAMWLAALATGIPTAGVIVYFLVRWLSNLG